MEAKKILQSDMLDILFENRNKEYGAYALRRQYGSHMNMAMLLTFGFGLIAALSSFFHKPEASTPTLRGRVMELIEIDTRPQPEKPVEPEKPKQAKPMKTEQFVTPKVEPDRHVDDRQEPPTLDELGHAVIGTIDHDGDKPETNESPESADKGDRREEAPRPSEPEVLRRVDIDAAFPGGTQAWVHYISREINRNMDELQEEGKSGTVLVQFVVDVEGNVSEVRIVGCPESGLTNCLDSENKLAEIAVAAIKRGPKWTPAVQNGRPVKAYRRQPVTFRLFEE